MHNNLIFSLYLTYVCLGRIVVADLTEGSQAFGSGIIHKSDEILQV